MIAWVLVISIGLVGTKVTVSNIESQAECERLYTKISETIGAINRHTCLDYKIAH